MHGMHALFKIYARERSSSRYRPNVSDLDFERSVERPAGAAYINSKFYSTYLSALPLHETEALQRSRQRELGGTVEKHAQDTVSLSLVAETR